MNIANMARDLNVELSQLSRDFENNINIGLEDYILNEKIKRACSLLRENHQLTVKGVSQLLGFYSCENFIRAFKKRIGKTPTEYRKINKGFDGFCNRRIGPADRRSGKKDRRSSSDEGEPRLMLAVGTTLDFQLGKGRRSGIADRRKGSPDRRRKNRKTTPRLI